MAMQDNEIHAGMTVTEDSTGRLGVITEPVGPRRGFAAVIWQGDNYAVRGWAAEMSPVKVLVISDEDSRILRRWAAITEGEGYLEEDEKTLLYRIKTL